MAMSIISLPQGTPLDSPKHVAAEVRALKGRYGVTQDQLATVLKIAQPAVSKRLRGVTPFTLAELDLLADFFHVEPGEFLGGPRDPRSPGGAGGGKPGIVPDRLSSRYADAA